MNILEINKRMKDINPNIKIISNTYKDAFSKLKCKCLIDGHTWTTTWSKLSQGVGCKMCHINSTRLTLDDIKEKLYIINPNIELLSNKYINTQTKLKCKCLICGYIWYTSWGSLYYYKSGCPQCAGTITKTNKEFVEEIYELVGNEYVFLEKYKNARTKIKIKHNKCNNVYYVTPNDFLSGRRCPHCCMSSGEQKIKEVLHNKNIRFIQEYSFDDLIGIGGQPLRFDFAIFNNINNLMLLIEYDGEFHFKKQYKNDGFETLQIHDERKNQYCKNNNISLLRIPYWEFDNINILLEQWLNKAKQDV